MEAIRRIELGDEQLLLCLVPLSRQRQAMAEGTAYELCVEDGTHVMSEAQEKLHVEYETCVMPGTKRELPVEDETHVGGKIWGFPHLRKRGFGENEIASGAGDKIWQRKALGLPGK
ncbi:hypothetical protein MRB53_014061 [Persea americana]|uniref:Uncharacterized protein n=1 Tax=Persea americana TaxID=3435 RepID=A0ACC2K9Q0_PERAE|nr:hypothetical protein MRB53_014061 [Persea americana]